MPLGGTVALALCNVSTVKSTHRRATSRVASGHELSAEMAGRCQIHGEARRLERRRGGGSAGRQQVAMERRGATGGPAVARSRWRWPSSRLVAVGKQPGKSVAAAPGLGSVARRFEAQSPIAPARIVLPARGGSESLEEAARVVQQVWCSGQRLRPSGGYRRRTTASSAR